MINERLIYERLRLNLSQDSLSEAAGISTRSQQNYERGSRTPDAEYLQILAKLGADIQYIVTGVRAGEVSAESITQEEAKVLALYKRAPEVVRSTVLNLLNASAYAAPEPKRASKKAVIKNNKISIDGRENRVNFG